jgi:hypothetical protein
LKINDGDPNQSLVFVVFFVVTESQPAGPAMRDDRSKFAGNSENNSNVNCAQLKLAATESTTRSTLRGRIHRDLRFDRLRSSPGG